MEHVHHRQCLGEKATVPYALVLARAAFSTQENKTKHPRAATECWASQHTEHDWTQLP